MTRVGIVCGYGTDAARLAGYVRIIGEAAGELDLLVTSGHGHPRSEAEVLAELLRPLGLPILTEERARTTAENLLFARELLRTTEVQQLTIFCDRIRRVKVLILARLLFGPGVRVVAGGRLGARWRYFVQPASIVWQLLALAVRKRTPPFDPAHRS